MNEAIFAAIMLICSKTPDTDACFAKYSKCILTQEEAVKQKHADCATKVNEKIRQECIQEANRMDRGPYRVIAECAVK